MLSPSGRAVRYQLDLRAVRRPATVDFTNVPTPRPARYMDSMNGGDRRDYSRLNVPFAAPFEILLESIRGDANFELIKDNNNNGIRDGGELVGSSASVSPARDQLQMNLDGGIYYLHIHRATERNLLYQLSIR